MELVSNVQTSIKSLCHKGPGRRALARSNAVVDTAPGREKSSRAGKTAIPERFTRVFALGHRLAGPVPVGTISINLSAEIPFSTLGSLINSTAG